MPAVASARHYRKPVQEVASMPHLMLYNSAPTLRWYPPLADEIGGLESLIFLQMDYWLHNGKQVKHEDGVAWLTMGQRAIAQAIGQSDKAIRNALEALEKKSLITRKSQGKGNKTLITIDWKGAATLRSIKVQDDIDTAEVRLKGAEVRLVDAHKEEDSLLSNESSSLQLRAAETLAAKLEALELENKRLQDELKKATAKKQKAAAPKPDNWQEVVKHVRDLWPDRVGEIVGIISTGFEKYPDQWPHIMRYLDNAFQQRAKGPGPFVLNAMKQGRYASEAEALVEQQEERRIVAHALPDRSELVFPGSKRNSKNGEAA